MCTTAVHSSVSFTLVLRLWLRSLPKAAFRLIPCSPASSPSACRLAKRWGVNEFDRGKLVWA
jgi:hypothetical protein